MSVLEVVEKFVSINGELYVLRDVILTVNIVIQSGLMRLMPQHSR